MKIALVKDWRDIGPWGNTSLISGKPKTIEDLETFYGRCHCWGLLRLCKTDLIIIDVPADWYDRQASNCILKGHRSDASWYSRHKDIETQRFGNKSPKKYCFPKPNMVNWGDYDIVITVNPFIEPDTIKEYPRTLFAFWHHERFLEYYDAHKLGYPIEKGWDVHLDHVEGTVILNDIPATIFAPYFMHPDIRKDFDTKKDMIWTERRTLEENKLLNNLWEHWIPNGFKWAWPTGFNKNNVLNGKRFYDILSQTKYFIYIRNSNGGSGQAALEAASMGSIVIGHHWSKTFQKIIHPFCKVEPDYIWASQYHNPFIGDGFGDLDLLSQKIITIEKDKKLYAEIIEYQDGNIKKIFTDSYLALKKALNIKRGMNA